MFRFHCTCNDEYLGELIALLAKTGKVTDIKHAYTPGRVEIAAKAPAPVTTSERAKPETEVGRRRHDPNAPTLANLARATVLDVLQKFHFRRVKGKEVLMAACVQNAADKQRIYAAFRQLMDEKLIVKVDYGEYELHPDELARYRIAHLPGGNGAQPIEQR